MGKQIVNLPEIQVSDLSDADLFVIVDVSDTSDSSSGKTKKITKANLLASSV